MNPFVTTLLAMLAGHGGWVAGNTSLGPMSPGYPQICQTEGGTCLLDHTSREGDGLPHLTVMEGREDVIVRLSGQDAVLVWKAAIARAQEQKAISIADHERQQKAKQAEWLARHAAQ